jgi:hypothetical protein
VTASTFALTRVPALMGRTLLEADERGDAEEVVVVGYDFWKNKLDGAADAVGRVIRISGTPVTIVGVMPRGYGFPQRNGVWRPLHLERIPEARRACGMSLGGWRRAITRGSDRPGGGDRRPSSDDVSGDAQECAPASPLSARRCQ